MNYVEAIENLLDKELKMKGTKYDDLLSLYSLLVMTVGKNCTQKTFMTLGAFGKTNNIKITKAFCLLMN